MDQHDLWETGVSNEWREYSEALSYARGLNFTSKEEWDRFVSHINEEPSLLPVDIPRDPDVQYRFLGWRSWEEWLGITHPQVLPVGKAEEPGIFDSKEEINPWLEFKTAREIVWGMGFEYKEEWQAYVKGLFAARNPLPANIPEDPDKIYRFTGWKDWKDWLVSPDRKIKYTDFHSSRDFTRSMRFLNKEAWREYIKGEPPLHLKYGLIIPGMPDLEYSAWVSWEDWLGTGIEYRSYSDTRQFVRSLGLKSEVQWRSYCKGGIDNKPPKPLNIFAYPEIGYNESGWISWEDWLGSKEENKAERGSGSNQLECRCKGRIKDCPECDGKGYYFMLLNNK